MKIGIGADGKDTSESKKMDKYIADTYKNKFVTPLDFEMLQSVIPYYQAGLGNQLCYVRYAIMFDCYDKSSIILGLSTQFGLWTLPVVLR